MENTLNNSKNPFQNDIAAFFFLEKSIFKIFKILFCRILLIYLTDF